MKINSELERVLRAEQAKATSKPKGVESSTSFDAVLQGTITASPSIGTTKQNPLEQVASQSPLASLEKTELSSIEGANATLGTNSSTGTQQIMNGIEQSLAGLNAYTQSLQNQNGADLKQAWQSLNAFNQSVSSLRQTYANMPKQDSSLDAMINDLEIMAVTETYKFNRGDYM